MKAQQSPDAVIVNWRRAALMCACVCVCVCVCVCLLLQTRHSDAVQPVARVPVLRPVAVGLITEPEKGG